jgi:hypothetical protein
MIEADAPGTVEHYGDLDPSAWADESEDRTKTTTPIWKSCANSLRQLPLLTVTTGGTMIALAILLVIAFGLLVPCATFA